MPFSLYDVTVPSFKQTLIAVQGLIGKAEAHCSEKSIAPAEFIGARLFEDMLPFAYQVKATINHSIGALESVGRGSFSPDVSPPPETFAALKERVAGALAALDAMAPSDINAYEGRDMFFEFKGVRLPFTAQDFLFSFSMPNFYFHATTAYDILRNKGVQIGKRDFMGPLRMKQ